MIRRRLSRGERETPNTTSRYDWKSNRDEGFSEVRFLYDKDGRLIGLDYKLPPDHRDDVSKSH